VWIYVTMINAFLVSEKNVSAKTIRSQISTNGHSQVLFRTYEGTAAMQG